MPSVEALRQHNLTQEEYARIVKVLGREPNMTELGIFSVMWSEHCSYKSSRLHLKKLPTRGDHVIQGPGENAGVVDIGEGLAVVFKIESHNHPSFIEPHQGAATGVGGIIRDIFTMGARPIGLLNSLRFGMPFAGHLEGPEPSGPSSRQPSALRSVAAERTGLQRHSPDPEKSTRQQIILEGVVGGIASYGNCIGIPTVGGEVFFHPCYDSNPLVNVFCLGTVRKDRIFYGRAVGPGNPVIYVGARTGRDGIHGATMASAEFDERSREKRPAVQVGDPFLEKLLLEACLEAMHSGAVRGIQDMGAAGLTCSTCEMGSRAGTGIEIDLARVPQREPGMIPYEIMLSESQERMLLVAEKGDEERVLQIFRKWDLDAVVIGRVTEDGMLTVKDHGAVVACIPNRVLAEEGPVYDRPVREPDYIHTSRPLDATAIPEPRDYNALVIGFVSSPNMCSRRWIFRQYDHMVRTNTCVLPGHDAAVIRVKESKTMALAMTLDGNPRYCYLHPRQGALLAVAEGCRNLSCVGAVPLAATNCLNFASPENPEVMWQFVESIEGIRQGCEYFGTPITGGNVSFYNETSGRGIYPTPVLGTVGTLDRRRVVTTGLKQEGDVLLLLGETLPELGASEYCWQVLQRDQGPVPALDLATEKNLHRLLQLLARDGLLRSAHDCSEGGLMMALLEKAFLSEGLGWHITLETELRPDVFLFSESQSRAVISCREEALEEISSHARLLAVPCRRIGRAIPEKLKLSVGGKLLIDMEAAAAQAAWSEALENAFES
ncbi:MAG: phosphoribosylformylglycinamidine synthase subunit PurL [Acidobacteria bacterium]|nr:phosphoribosylformylglycinamidine synthase subunit PurL [Acidobacteriota bacterium]